MTSEPKRRRLTAPMQTTMTDQLSLPSQVLGDELAETHSGDKGKQTPKGSDMPSNTDHGVDLYSNVKGDMKHIRRYACDILQHSRSTVKLRQDGSILITPHLIQIPNEVASMIINHLAGDQKTLYQCTLVTTQFYVLANPLLWKVLNFRTIISFERFLTCIHNAPQQRLKMVGQHIHELRLCGPHCTDAHLSWSLPQASYLKPITIHPPTHTIDTCLEQLLRHCQYLSTLEMTFLPLGRLCFFTIGRYCRQLCDFEWNLCYDQNPEWLAMLSDCPLASLRLTSIHLPLNAKVMTIIMKLGHLAVLSVFNPKSTPIKSLLAATSKAAAATTDNNNDNTPSLDWHDQGILHPAVATYFWWPQLTSLILFPCKHIDNTTLLGFLKARPHLQELSLMCVTKLTDTSLDAIATWLPHLTHLSLTFNYNISVDGVQQFVRKCPGLKKLKLYWCLVGLTDDVPGLLEPTDRPSVALLDQKTMDSIRQAAQENEQQQQQQQQQQ